MRHVTGAILVLGAGVLLAALGSETSYHAARAAAGTLELGQPGHDLSLPEGHPPIDGLLPKGHPALPEGHPVLPWSDPECSCDPLEASPKFKGEVYELSRPLKVIST